MSSDVRKIGSAKFYYTDPRNILNDVNSIPELYYLANLVMSGGGRGKSDPEIPLHIGYEAYSKLISFYGGTSVYIPTREELQTNLLGVMSYYYFSIQGLSWNDTMKKLGLTPTKGSRRMLRNRWRAFKDIVDAKEGKIPGFEIPPEREPKSLEAPIKCDDAYVKKDVFLKVVKFLCEDLEEAGVLEEEAVTSILARYE